VEAFFWPLAKQHRAHESRAVFKRIGLGPYASRTVVERAHRPRAVFSKKTDLGLCASRTANIRLYM
jgi:hypothetical protein